MKERDLNKIYTHVNQHVFYESVLVNNPYPGRGIVIGKNLSGTHTVQIYFIMGRSANSRNRIFQLEDNVVRTKPFDPSKVEDPSLIIYDALLEVNGQHIVTNGDQTSTIEEFLKVNKEFEEALATRDYEPDAPNYTPRISGAYKTGRSHAKLSILKRAVNGDTSREYFDIDINEPGIGRIIHTYENDGNPLPSFSGQPKIVKIPETIQETADKFWDLLNRENRISIVVKYIDTSSGTSSYKIINKYLHN